MVLKNRNM